VIYLDTGCLLKLYYPEPESEAVAKLVATELLAIPFGPKRRRIAGPFLLDGNSRWVHSRRTMGRTAQKPRGLSLEALTIAVLGALRDAGEGGLTKQEIVSKIGNTSSVSVQRALKDLREQHDAQIEYLRQHQRWRLTAPFGMPLQAPECEDLVAVLIAQAILEPLADADLLGRVQRLAEDLDERARRRASSERLPSPASVSATLTLGTPVDAGILSKLLTHCRRSVLRIEYVSPWKPRSAGRRSYTIEPWSLRVHDGVAYLRAWGRDAGAPRTFRVAQIETIEPCPEKPNQAVPRSHQIWGDEHPAFGIDHDRPGTAIVRLRGAVARWVARVQWHRGQSDRWIEDDELLERTVAYRSCRELARRLASVLDAIESIEPAELRMEVERITRVASVERELPGVRHRVRGGAHGARTRDTGRTSPVFNARKGK